MGRRVLALDAVNDLGALVGEERGLRVASSATALRPTRCSLVKADDAILERCSGTNFDQVCDLRLGDGEGLLGNQRDGGGDLAVEIVAYNSLPTSGAALQQAAEGERVERDQAEEPADHLVDVGDELAVAVGNAGEGRAEGDGAAADNDDDANRPEHVV